jgi:hypothetical protein
MWQKPGAAVLNIELCVGIEVAVSCRSCFYEEK